eukprot:CAMPEP_0117039230 /NCGR_PEP_ID=MMETSP0472-20121206/27554_1 /TAXON_ID=693140 ORGANISM="Tiarina fusus, Strain LIS" /NCGR_SAMPLE_ID=MMETSP0472 /ASSEMBLY_ACC=CAM_ASM_000603 /LENGTH=96 /DNA_ID=CAMNT_0004749679 /DNA_START=256 /DNA_END=542 /DNA_ORIENTATION=+
MLALQSKIDQNRWITAVGALAQYFDAELREAESTDKSDNELEEDFIEQLDKGYDSEENEEMSLIPKRIPTEEVFVIKKKKSRSKRHASSEDSTTSS